MSTEVMNDLVCNIQQSVEVNAKADKVFRGLIERMTNLNSGPNTPPLRLKLEEWPGGRWYRDLGNNTGHLWGHVQSIKPPVLLDWRDVLGNVLFQVEMRGLDRRRFADKARRLLDQVGLAEFMHAHPFELSGGMKQRCAIARALVHDPRILLMDEPFGALDALTREQMRIDLERLWLDSPKTVLFITHSIDEAVMLADRVVVMSPRPGRIERILPVGLPRPRGFAARADPGFTALTEEITRLFLARGVFH